MNLAIEKPTTKTLGVRRIVKDVKSGKIDTNHRVQRRLTWKLDQKQGLMASILEGYDIPSIYAIEDEDGVLSLLDGKQRITATVQFIEGEYTLGEAFTDLDEEYFSQFGEEIALDHIAGKYYNELPKEIQDEFQTFIYNFRIYKKLTDDQVKNLFYRLNRGTALNSMELLRVDADFMLDEIQKLENGNFFKNVVNMTENARNRFTDQEVIIQSMALLYYEEVGFSKKDMKDFVKEIKEYKEKGVQEYDELINMMNEIILDYFKKAFGEEKIKELRKVHIPTLVKLASKVMKNVEPEKFGEWARLFLQENTGRGSNSDYKVYISGATTKKETITDRYEFMLKDFERYIAKLDSKQELEYNDINDATNVTEEIMQEETQEISI